MSGNWEFVYALPNLTLRAARRSNDVGDWPRGIDFGTDVVVLASGEDPRVAELRIAEKGAETILSAFRDFYGKSYVPSVILVRTSAPAKLRQNAAAFNDFRNALAFTFLLAGRASSARGNSGSAPTWSDTFDFHPVQINRHGRVIIQSPAMLAGIDEAALSLSCSAAV